MDREDFIRVCDESLKAVRNEYSINQEKMAYILGISKKTLVEIEKGRSSLGWSVSVTLCTLFEQSSVIVTAFGGRASAVILSIAFDSSEPEYRRAHTTRIWWNTVLEKNGMVIEKNIVSQHYRLVSQDNRIIASSFDIDDLTNLMK